MSKPPQHQSQHQQQLHSQQSPGGLVRNPGLLLAAKKRLEIGILRKTRDRAAAAAGAAAASASSDGRQNSRRHRFRSADEAVGPQLGTTSPSLRPTTPGPTPSPTSKQHQPQRQQRLEDLCDSVCSTLSDCSILKSGRFLSSNQGGESSSPATASAELAAALLRLRASRNPAGRAAQAGEATAAASESAGGSKAVGGYRSAVLHSFSSEIGGLVRAGVDSLSLNRAYSRSELLTIIRRLGAAFLIGSVVPPLLERLESVLLQRMLASGLVMSDGDTFFRSGRRCGDDLAQMTSGAAASGTAPPPVPKLRISVPPQIRCPSSRSLHRQQLLHQQQQQQQQQTHPQSHHHHQQQQQQHHHHHHQNQNQQQTSQKVQSPYFVGSGSASHQHQYQQLLHQQLQQLHQRSSSAHNNGQQQQPHHQHTDNESSAHVNCRQNSSPTTVASGNRRQQLQQQQQQQPQMHNPMPSTDGQLPGVVTQNFVVRDNQLLRSVLVDPEDRRIRSIGQRHGCVITVYDRTRRLGHNAHRVTICAPSDKALRMCVRALDKGMGWDFNSQLAYARRKSNLGPT